MAAERICTVCGYEGRGKAGERGSGVGLKILGMLLMLPIYTIWRTFTGRSGNICPNCGAPAMVKVTSNAGALARQRIDIELGVLKPKSLVEEKKETFGAEQPAERVTRTVDPDQW